MKQRINEIIIIGLLALSPIVGFVLAKNNSQKLGISPVQITDTIGTLRTTLNELINIASTTVSTSTFSATAPIFYNANTATFSLGITAVSSTRAINTSGGIQGGGDLSADRTLTLGFTIVSSSRAINTTNGIAGGGDLSADRTLYNALRFTNGTNIIIASSSPIWTFSVNQLFATATITTATTTNLYFGAATGTSISFLDGTTKKTAYKDIGFTAINATTTTNVGASSSIPKTFYRDTTIIRIDCSTDGASVEIGADERASSSPNTYGTAVFNGGKMLCDSNGESTTTFNNATISGNNGILNFGITSSTNSTTTLKTSIKYQDD